MKKPFAVYYFAYGPHCSPVTQFDQWFDNVVRSVRVKYFRFEKESLDFFNENPHAFRVVDRCDGNPINESCLDCRMVFLMEILIPGFKQFGKEEK